MRTLRLLVIAALAGTLPLVGCQRPQTRDDARGKVIYLDGAGNWGFGARAVPDGLRQAGFQGEVEAFAWTRSFVPLIDHFNTPAARSAAQRLADRITDYRQHYPDQPLHIVALSAGTGVAVWACEMLPPHVHIDQLVLLGSSLSHDYDIAAALRHVRGRVYVYHSPHDAVLNTVQLLGTTDQRWGTKSVGQVGLHPPSAVSARIINTPWSSRWEELGWRGGHTDCIGVDFMREEIGRKLVPQPTLAGFR